MRIGHGFLSCCQEYWGTSCFLFKRPKQNGWADADVVMWKLAVAVFGTAPVGENTAKGKVTQSDGCAQVDGDPKLLDDSEYLLSES
ncbi:uncharacterized protein LOC125469507 isoform X2 [Pyrus x bretschneideri]|uniref:uncharacterized protein LOC125469507 isoform X2 n=1 Tax=Pyrus x bretschneideri TaxID=225117 RepID=UPI00202F5ECE|nr:uncharacterized protein LOC125469507 isoform X2 [Pyrus x bretschneideri]